MNIDGYVIVLPEYDERKENPEDYEKECLQITFHKLNILPYEIKKRIGSSLDYSGPAAYCTALSNYIESHSPYNVEFPYEEIYDNTP